MKRPNYLSNRDFLAEIHSSKKTFSYFIDDRFGDFDAIAPSLSAITPEFAATVLASKKNTKTSADDLVFRVMTYEHVPLSTDKKTRSRTQAGQGHTRTNFPPFKHYMLTPTGDVREVGRSHWRGGFENGAFSLDHGRMTNRLARMFMLLVERYAQRANFRGYSYIEEMQASALVQLVHAGLMFDESKGNNPFAFFTTTVRNCFVKVLNVEKGVRDLRDDLLIEAGMKPSLTRQIEGNKR